MTESPAFRRFVEVAQKWRDLVELRSVQFIELHKTGHWKLYYGEARFLLLMREAVMLAEVWSRIAPRPEDGAGAFPEDDEDDPAADFRRRAAA
jgi:hypothetical protein